MDSACLLGENAMEREYPILTRITGYIPSISSLSFTVSAKASTSQGWFKKPQAIFILHALSKNLSSDLPSLIHSSAVLFSQVNKTKCEDEDIRFLSALFCLDALSCDLITALRRKEGMPEAPIVLYDNPHL